MNAYQMIMKNVKGGDSIAPNLWTNHIDALDVARACLATLGEPTEPFTYLPANKLWIVGVTEGNHIYVIVKEVDLGLDPATYQHPIIDPKDSAEFEVVFNKVTEEQAAIIKAKNEVETAKEEQAKENREAQKVEAHKE